ncbi:SCO family protein [Loktanella sp. D2R18]|uniref:SCO family protein n=1 Tax=Rhodobacterales TaxID=204455 RepID=UPI000DE95281|nr:MULTISPECIES: SCO family protein [Rhodobacterales]MDO6590759.1 SCO family protein [Yoonia sp. 1_MG-2023]RBW44625.1 SCO family protein [Loktanella sp. D2R18]
MKAVIIGSATLAVAAGLGFYTWTVSQNANGVPCGDTSVAGAAIGGPFELVSETGETVTDIDVITKPTLVYFGYTFCPDVCPLDSARNAAAAYILEDQGHDIGTVFITIDPARDTPQIVGDFADNFHDDMIGLTGSAEQVDAASKAYRTYYRKQEGDPEYYLVDHSTQTYLMFPETGFATFFKRDHTAEQIAETTACFIDQLS